MSDKRQGGTSGSWPDPPFADWEVPEGRRRMPPDLQRIVGASSPVLRIGPNVYEKLATRDDGARLTFFERLNGLLADWRYMDPVGPGAERWQVYSLVDGRWVLTVIGLGSDGGNNIITMYPVNDRSMRGRLAGGTLIRRGE